MINGLELLSSLFDYLNQLLTPRSLLPIHTYSLAHSLTDDLEFYEMHPSVSGYTSSPFSTH